MITNISDLKQHLLGLLCCVFPNFYEVHFAVKRDPLDYFIYPTKT